MTRKAVLPLTTMAAAVTAVVVALVLLVGTKPAEAAFPGQNGNIVFNRWEGDWEIYSMPSTGGTPTNLTTNSTNAGHPDVAPGGKKVAYVGRTADGKTEIFTIPITGGTPTRVTNNGIDEGRPSWSPDGKRIAFEVFDGNDWEIGTVPSTGGTLTRLTNDLKHDEAPEWSPDGSKIAYAHRDGTGDYEIATVPSDGGTPKYLTNEDRGDVNPDWSPNGARIVYQHCDFEGHGDTWAGHAGDDYDDCDIYSVPSGGGTPTELTDTKISFFEWQFGCGGQGCELGSESELTPAYSPDGRKIVFNKRDYVERPCPPFPAVCFDPLMLPAEPAAIYTMPSTGGSYAQLTSGSEVDEDPDWGQVPDNTPPDTAILSGPDRYFSGTTATFWFDSDEDFSSFQCLFEAPSADIAAWEPCSSPQRYSNLQHGHTYTFSVLAVDVAGNHDPTPDSRTFTVDLRAPTVTDVRPASGSTTTDRTPTIAATVSDDVIDLDSSRIKLYIDGPATGTTDRRQITDFAYDRATDRLTYTPPSGIGLGEQTVTVVASDLANNQAMRTWKFQIVR